MQGICERIMEEVMIMSDRMRPVPFADMLRECITEYKDSGTFYGVPVDRSHGNVPIGPAAGPHTQLAGNIVAAYAAGANSMELKTVQQLTGKDLDIKKPCIYTGNEVFNIEWSTELSVPEALAEYIKAYLLIQVLSKEFGFEDAGQLRFIMSVGYDLKGIQSETVDQYINFMKHASTSEEWKRDINCLMEHSDLLEQVTKEDLAQISDVISDTVTLSTMHGCKSTEIEKIAVYLIREKQLHTYVKMNPTLIGKENLERIRLEKGYDDLVFDEESFTQDIDLSMALEIILHAEQTARENGKIFGVKMTNTLPVRIQKNELEGTQMYMSGPPLYAISILAAALLAEQTQGRIPISYSGGADMHNIRDILETGIAPVTVSSLLLKRGGYKNLTQLLKKAEGTKQKGICPEAVKALAKQALEDVRYNKKEHVVYAKAEQYDCFCAKCTGCVDVCPNRANIRISVDGKSYVIHRDRLCNECGNCAYFCIQGYVPYLRKFTLFEMEEDFLESQADGVLYTHTAKRYRKNGEIGDLPMEIEQIIRIGFEKGKL